MDKKMTLEQFAHDVLGNSDRKGYLSQIENGKRSITPLTAKRLAVELDIPDDILAPMLSNETADQEDVDVDRLLRKNADLEAKLIELSRQSGRSDNLHEEGITEKAIIRLAQRVAADTDEVGQAWLELQNAMDVAVRVQADGRVTSNHGDFVDVVLKRAAELAAEGEYGSAGAEIDEALAREEQESAARKAKLFERGVEIALLDRDTERAAALLVRKADLEAGGEADFEALRSLQDFYYERGRDKGINLDLELAIDLAGLVKARARGFVERGNALNDLAIALDTLGQRESGTARLDEAVTAYKAALEERTRDKVPLDWAMTQNNLGIALESLGQRESGTARLDEAVTAYRAALEERTRDKIPLLWAAIQNNLGAALTTLGQRESGTARLEEAVTAYRAVLEERTRDKVPLDWAETQNNLGNALQSLGQRESGTARLDEAVTAYTAALEESARDKVPLDWATTQNNLGTVLQTLGERESSMAQLDEAVTAFRAALEERTRDKVPFDWALTQENLALLEISMFEKTSQADHLERAMAYAEAAQEVYVEANAGFYIEKVGRLIAQIQARRDAV